jgi:hypothetical protein
MIDIHDVRWWYWLATALLLGVALIAGSPLGIPLAVALAVVQVLHFGARDGATSFPAQVRVAYLAILIAGGVPGLGVLHWIQLFGTTAMVTVGYCPLARCLSLLPWNRRGPLDLAALRRAFLTPPVRGSILSTTDSPARPAT